MRKRFIIFLWFLSICLVSKAQSFDTRGLLGAEYEMKIMKGWHWGAETEVRFNQNFTHYDRLKLGVGTDYTFWKKRVKVGVAYDFLNYQQEDYFENRHRVGLRLSYTQKFQQCKISYRALFQSTFRDERRGDYKFNPKTYMRNRLAFTYNFPSQPLKLYASEEFWWRLYHPENKIIDATRTIVGVEYDINKHQSLDFYLSMDDEVQVSDPKHALSLGIVYSYK